jgi:transcriptional antiterminator NusG
VSGFISAGRTPVALEEAEVAGILEQAKGDQEKPKPKVPFQQGELVKIIEGPFSNFLGTVDEINPERGRVKVLVKIFERLTSVELEFWQVEKG